MSNEVRETEAALREALEASTAAQAAYESDPCDATADACDDAHDAVAAAITAADFARVDAARAGIPAESLALAAANVD